MRRGFEIAFVGVDGSGKSTLASEIGARLFFLGGRRCIYLGPTMGNKVLSFCVRYLRSLEGRLRAISGSVTIYDRSMYDMVAYRSRRSRVGVVLARCVLKPDYTVLCEAPRDVVLTRKVHENPDRLWAINARYRELLHDDPHTLIVDTSKTLDQTIKEIMRFLGPRIVRSFV